MKHGTLLLMLAPLSVLFEGVEGPALPLPTELAAFYGPLRFTAPAGRPHVIANFVSTLDGVTSWNIPGRAGGGEISGFSAEDTAVMGLLRAASDAVIVGAGTLRVVPDDLWTPHFFHPELAGSLGALRAALGLRPAPLAVIVTGSGAVDLGLRVFTSGEEPALIVSTPGGAQRLAARGVPPGVGVAALQPERGGQLTATAITHAVADYLGAPAPRLLVEGGPQLMATFLAGRALDELFLTLAPQVAGRDPAQGAAGWRPGLVEGALLAPDAPAWGRLVGLRQLGSHLFLRYRFGL